MVYLETKTHSLEISSWAAAYFFVHKEEYDALVAEHGEHKAERIAAERAYESYHLRKPDWPADEDSK